ncbi:hypothetical protein [Tropicimonas sp. IMCC34043]|uniref:hypothetical protein n=1 Tax=Tropicimonas sp. IMCC34043 TaxID=2248760 RepID=UPI0013005F23|nr:hypothetical protein [Tropicimonas sp. IMCC34043]
MGGIERITGAAAVLALGFDLKGGREGMAGAAILGDDMPGRLNQKARAPQG